MDWKIFLFILIVAFAVYGIYYFTHSDIPTVMPYTEDKTVTISWSSSSCDCSTTPPGSCCGEAPPNPSIVEGEDLGESIIIEQDNLTVQLTSDLYTKMIVTEFEFFNDQGEDVTDIFLKNTSETSSNVRKIDLLGGSTVKQGSTVKKTFSDDDRFLYLELAFIPTIRPRMNSNTTLTIKCKFI